MNSISLSDFLAALPFASPEMWIETLRLAMAERGFRGVPGALGDVFRSDDRKFYHPDEALAELWGIASSYDSFIFDPADFTENGLRNTAIRMNDPARRGQRAGEELIAPIRMTNFIGGDTINIYHLNAGAIHTSLETVGSSSCSSRRFGPRCQMNIIAQTACFINSCLQMFLMPRRGVFSVPDIFGATAVVDVHIYYLKIDRRTDETSGFGTFFSGALAPGSYSVSDETHFDPPSVGDEEKIYYAGYLDFSGGNLQYLY